MILATLIIVSLILAFIMVFIAITIRSMFKTKTLVAQLTAAQQQVQLLGRLSQGIAGAHPPAPPGAVLPTNPGAVFPTNGPGVP